MRKLFTALILILWIPGMAYAADRKVLYVPKITWMEVAQQVSNANSTFSPRDGDSCVLRKSGRISIVGIDQKFGVLVRYDSSTAELAGRPPNAAAGTECPTGALGFLSSKIISTWSDKMENAAPNSKEAKREAAVKRLLAAEQKQNDQKK